MAIILAMALFLALAWSFFHKRVLYSSFENDQALLRAEQNILSTSIGQLHQELRSTVTLIERTKMFDVRTTKPKVPKRPDPALAGLEETLEFQRNVLTFYGNIFKNNSLLLDHYFDDTRLEYEIRRSELLLTDLDELSADDTVKQYAVQNSLNYLFRRASMDTLQDDLPSLRVMFEAGQNPYPSRDGLNGIDMLVSLLQSPLIYLLFLLALVPAGLVFANQFASGRMNIFFGIYARRKAYKKFILQFIRFWLVAYLLIYLIFFLVATLQNGAGSSSQIMLLSDNSILTQKQFIAERIPLFTLFALQSTLLLLFLSLKSSSVNPVLLGSGLIIIFHFASQSFGTKPFMNRIFNPIHYLNMDFDLSPFTLTSYVYFAVSIVLLFFLLRHHFVKYQDR